VSKEVEEEWMGDEALKIRIIPSSDDVVVIFAD